MKTSIELEVERDLRARLELSRNSGVARSSPSGIKRTPAA